nr:immunoglobulin heavy chain junction region [Mus musculus]
CARHRQLRLRENFDYW